MNYSNYSVVANETDEKRLTFYKQTYMHVALAVLGFVVVEYLFFQIPALLEFALSLTQGMTWLLVLGAFMFATNYAERLAMNTHDLKKQYMALGIYVVAEAFIFIPLLYMAMVYTGGDFSMIKQAAVMTLALFGGLSAVVFITKKDFSFLRSALTIGGFVAIGFIIAGSLFGFHIGIWFSFAMVLLAAGSILYQTSNIIHKYGSDQYVAASLGLFSSLMLLFWYILQIFMSRD